MEAERCPNGIYKGTEDVDWVICELTYDECPFYHSDTMLECEAYKEAIDEIHGEA